MPLLVGSRRSEYTILDISRLSWRGRIYAESVGERARRTEGFVGQVQGPNICCQLQFRSSRTRGAVALAHQFAGVDMVITLLC